MYLENQIANKDIHTFSQNGVYVMEQKKTSKLLISRINNRSG